MDTKETKKIYRSDTILVSDVTYYKFIFKKTEKIVCAVFYILKHTDKSHDSLVSESVLESGKKALECVLRTLSCRWYAASDELYRLLEALIALASNLSVAQAVALIQEDVADMLILEINVTIRTLREYLSYEQQGSTDLHTLQNESVLRSTKTGVSRSSFGKGGREEVLPLSDVVDGRERRLPHTRSSHKGHTADRQHLIKDILSLSSRSTIKDISERLSDVSEKTIQRELLSMLRTGEVLKEGERRWTRYFLASGT